MDTFLASVQKLQNFKFQTEISKKTQFYLSSLTCDIPLEEKAEEIVLWERSILITYEQSSLDFCHK